VSAQYVLDVREPVEVAASTGRINGDPPGLHASHGSAGNPSLPGSARAGPAPALPGNPDGGLTMVLSLPAVEFLVAPVPPAEHTLT
jgi:hypothetical protein